MTTEEQVWTLAHEPVTADELVSLRDRLIKDAQAQSDEARNAKTALPLSWTIRHRLLIDADHLSRLLDGDTGTSRLTFTVSVKPKTAARKKKAAIARKAKK